MCRRCALSFPGFVFLFFLGFSQASWAITSFCSETPLPDGRQGLKHETSWSLYDNWFYNLYAQVRTEVEGPVSANQLHDIPMLAGGHTTFILAEPADGEYTLRGEVQVGYPGTWGFDGYYTIACPTWQGTLANNDSDEQSDETSTEATAIVGAMPITFDDILASACEDEQNPEACAYLQSLSESEQKQMVADRQEARKPLIQATGFIAGVDEQSLTLRTTTGRYYHFVLPDILPSLTRHTEALLSAIEEGDQVFVQRPLTEQHPPQIQALRGDVETAKLPLFRRPHSSHLVNRSALQSQAETLDSTDLDREQRVSQTLELTYELDGSKLEIPAESTITIVAPAAFSDLVPMQRYVRVIAHPSGDEDDPTPIVRAVEILN